MKIALFSFVEPAFPCSKIRFFDPLSNCNFRGGLEIRAACAPTDRGYAMDNEAASWADVVVVQRSFPRAQTQSTIDHIFAAGKPVVYETDDCLPEIPDYHGKPYYRATGPFIHDFAARADAVTVSTPELKTYFEARAKRVVLLPNYVSLRRWGRLSRPPKSLARRIVYFGNSGHAGDFGRLVTLLNAMIDQDPRLEIVFIGVQPPGIREGSRVRFVPADFCYDNFPSLLRQFAGSVGIAPLSDNLFNRCISPLKFFEYSLAGIAGVYADLAPYRDTIEHGRTGFLCGKDEACWRAALEALLANPVMRAGIAEAAAAQVCHHYAIEDHADQWRDFYQSLLA